MIAISISSATLAWPSTVGASLVDSAKPASYEEFIAAFDLAKFPKMPGASKETSGDAYMNYSVAAKIPDAMAFSRKALVELGWSEVAEKIAGLDPEKYDLAYFEKAGFSVSVYVAKGMIDGKPADGKVDVYVQSQGNVDPRELPKPADAKIVRGNPSSLTFTTASKPEAVEEFCRKEFPPLGWKEEGDDSAAFHRKEGRYILHFVQNAMKVLIVISKNAEGLMEANYYPQLREHAELLTKTTNSKAAKPATLKETIAAIDFRKFPRFKKTATETVSSAGVFYQVDGAVADAVAFYRTRFDREGWKEVKPVDLELEDRLYFHVAKGGYQVQIGIQKDSKTGKVEVSIRNEGNVDVRQIPRPDKDTRLGLAQHANVYYTTAVGLEETTKFLRDELKKAGWKESGSTENLPGKVLKFYQGGIRLVIEIGQNAEGRTDVKLNPWVIGAP